MPWGGDGVVPMERRKAEGRQVSGLHSRCPWLTGEQLFEEIQERIMTSREKVNRALAHHSGPVPLDFGATAVTGMHVSIVAGLREYYGLEPRPVKVSDPYQMLGLIEDDLAEVLGIDTIGVPTRMTMFGFPNEDWKEFTTPWGQRVLVAGQFEVKPATDGGLWIYPQGDTEAPPSGHMPAGGYFFDALIRQEGEVDEENLNPEDNCEEFGLLTEADCRYYEQAIAAASRSQRAVVAALGGLAFGDIAMVPAPGLKHPRGVRDIASWYMATVANPEFIKAVFDYQLRIALRNLETFRQIAGDRIDVLFICGTDFGTQTSTFCSREAFAELYQPYYRAVNDWIHQHTGWKTFKHSCGAVANFMPDFIESGFDIINPVQCSARGMDPVMLKERYGDRLTFWGAGIDTQHVLPFGTPEEVRRQTLERCEIFGHGGGFVFNSIHNVQAQTPIANLVAMFEAFREYQAGV